MTFPLDELLKENQEYEWTDKCPTSFNILKKKLVRAPILQFPNWLIKFHVHIDASEIVIEEILSQPGDEGMDHPNVYDSQNMNKRYKNYSNMECEGLGMIFSLQKYRNYLLDNPFIFFTNHQALKYFINKPLHHGLICKWLLLFP